MTQHFAFYCRNKATFSKKTQGVGVKVDSVDGGGGGSRNFLSLLKTEKLQHKPALPGGKWFSGPVLPEQQGVLLDIMSFPSKQ